jgi:ABC-type uncharacterized transport system permease subunit
MRYRNVIAAGIIAGIGGAYFTIGSVGSFGKDMSSGEGYIALAAMIFGRYTPFGAVAAALLFGFATQLQSIMSTLNTPIQSNLLLMTPYIVTIIVLAGLVGKVRGPRAEGTRGLAVNQGRISVEDLGYMADLVLPGIPDPPQRPIPPRSFRLAEAPGEKVWPE